MRDVIEIRHEDHYWFKVDYAWIIQSLLEEDAFLLVHSKSFLVNLYKQIERKNHANDGKTLYFIMMKLDEKRWVAYISEKQVSRRDAFAGLKIGGIKRTFPEDRMKELEQTGSVVVESKSRAYNLIKDYKAKMNIKERGGYELLELKEKGYVLRLQD